MKIKVDNKDQREKSALQNVQNALNTIVLAGQSLPRTSEGMMILLGKYASKEELILFFKEGKVKWTMGMGEGTSYEDYNREMNEAAEKYMMI